MKLFRLFSLLLLAACAIFSLAQTILVSQETVQEIYRGNTSASWPATIGTIASSEAVWHEGKRGAYQQAEVHYRYRVGNTSYIAERIGFGMRHQDQDQVRGLLIDYPVGKEVIVRYQAADPAVATLVRGVDPAAYWMLMLIPILIVMTLFFGVFFLAVYQSTPEEFRGHGGPPPTPSPRTPLKQHIWVAPDEL